MILLLFDFFYQFVVALITALDIFGNVTTCMHVAMTPFSKDDTALCVHSLNDTAKFDPLLQNLVRFGPSSLANSLYHGIETS